MWKSQSSVSTDAFRNAEFFSSKCSYLTLSNNAYMMKIEILVARSEIYSVVRVVTEHLLQKLHILLVRLVQWTYAPTCT